MSITKKTILLISPTNKIGGKASFTKRLIEVYNKHGIQYYHIDLVRARSKCQLIRILQHIYSFIYYKLLLIKYLYTKDIDIVQIHTSSYLDFYDLSFCIIISKVYKKKVIVRYGGAEFPSFYRYSIWIARKYLKWAITLPDKLIVQSIYWYKYFIELGVKESSLIIIPNFVDDNMYSFNDSKYMKDVLDVLFMPASSLRRKGFIDIKNSIQKLANDYHDITFHIVGPEVYKYISGSNIKTYNYIEGKDKTDLFNLCNIYLLPTHSEGFPNSLIEAMASGMAVISTNIPQIKCLVIDEYNCLLIDPGSASQFEKVFSSLISDKNKIKYIGKNARKLVEERYSKKLMQKYLTELYNGKIEK
jgi:glycosyltransferase involved in cell wall biosynthesis